MKYEIIKTTFVLLAVHCRMLTGSEAADNEESPSGSVPAALPLRGVVEVGLSPIPVFSITACQSQAIFTILGEFIFKYL